MKPFFNRVNSTNYDQIAAYRAFPADLGKGSLSCQSKRDVAVNLETFLTIESKY